MNTGLWLETLTPLSKYLKDKIDKKSTRMEENTPVLSLAGSLYIYGTLCPIIEYRFIFKCL